MEQLVTNMALIIPVCAWVISQLLKVVFLLARERRMDWGLLVRSGGMPSSHTALVCSLATVVAMEQGFGSAAFAISAIVAAVVMYDAAGVRRSVSRQSVVLDRVVRELRERRPFSELERDLRLFIGHSPFQVIVGAAMGIFIAWFWLILSG